MGFNILIGRLIIFSLVITNKTDVDFAGHGLADYLKLVCPRIGGIRLAVSTPSLCSTKCTLLVSTMFIRSSKLKPDVVTAFCFR